MVTAQGGNYAAGIGGGRNGTGSNITIHGGTVKATGGDRGAGIGGGSGTGGTGGTGSNITISGGTVTATGGSGAAGIGGGLKGGTSSGFSTTAADDTTGNAFIVASSIGDTGDQENWSGVIITGSTYNSATKTASGGTGQVYGEPTLTTDATVPAGATLTIPENTTLTVGAGSTLTNSGKIYVDTVLTYGGEDYGALTNNGTIYYHLTVDGGSATEDSTTTYDDKTYAEENAAVTLTAEDKVGLAFKDWTASPTSANVTFSKVDENDETNQNYQFTMPAQVLTVTAGYENAPAYTVTIPASVDIGGSAEIKAEGVAVAEGYNLYVKLTGTGNTDNTFTLALADDNTETLAYTVTKGTGEDATEVKVKDTVLTVAGGKANSSGSSTLTFALAQGAVVKYSGSYTGTVTFAVSVETADSTGGTD